MTLRPSTLVLAQVQLDDIRFADGREIHGQLGGAGAYAAVGAALSSTAKGRIGIVCGIGADFDRDSISSLREYGLDVTGMKVKDANTPRSRITYRADSSRSEYPVFGRRHFARVRPEPADVPADWRPPNAVFLFQDADEGIFDRLENLCDPGTVVLWEIDVVCCDAKHRDRVGSLLPRVDWLSINLAEARALVGREEPMTCVRAIHELGAARVCLRMGAEGAIVSDCDTEVCVQTDAPARSPVDPTGAGNAYGGALLETWVRTNDLAVSAKTAAAVASFVIEQFGLPPFPSHTALSERASTINVRELHGV